MQLKKKYKINKKKLTNILAVLGCGITITNPAYATDEEHFRRVQIQPNQNIDINNSNRGYYEFTSTSGNGAINNVHLENLNLQYNNYIVSTDQTPITINGYVTAVNTKDLQIGLPINPKRGENIDNLNIPPNTPPPDVNIKGPITAITDRDVSGRDFSSTTVAIRGNNVNTGDITMTTVGDKQGHGDKASFTTVTISAEKNMTLGNLSTVPENVGGLDNPDKYKDRAQDGANKTISNISTTKGNIAIAGINQMGYGNDWTIKAQGNGSTINIAGDLNSAIAPKYATADKHLSNNITMETDLGDITIGGNVNVSNAAMFNIYTSKYGSQSHGNLTIGGNVNLNHIQNMYWKTNDLTTGVIEISNMNLFTQNVNSSYSPTVIDATGNFNLGGLKVNDGSTVHLQANSGKEMNAGALTTVGSGNIKLQSDKLISATDINLQGSGNITLGQGAESGDIKANTITNNGTGTIDLNTGKNITIAGTITNNASKINLTGNNITTGDIVNNAGHTNLKGSTITSGQLLGGTGKLTASATGDVSTQNIIFNNNGQLDLKGANITTGDIQFTDESTGSITATGNLSTGNMVVESNLVAKAEGNLTAGHISVTENLTASAKGDVNIKNILANGGTAAITGKNVTGENISSSHTGNLTITATENITTKDVVVDNSSTTLEGKAITTENITIINNGNLNITGSEDITTKNVVMNTGTTDITGKNFTGDNISNTHGTLNITTKENIITKDMVINNGTTNLTGKAITTENISISNNGDLIITGSGDITTKNIVINTGEATISGENFNGDNLSNTHGTLNITAQGNIITKDLAVNNGNTKLTGQAITTDNIGISNNGRLTITGSGDITTKNIVMDSGTAKISGQGISTEHIQVANNGNLALTGNGDVTAKNIVLENGNANISGQGVITEDIQVTNEGNLTITGTGDLSTKNIVLDNSTAHISGQSIAGENVQVTNNGNLTITATENIAVKNMVINTGTAKITGKEITAGQIGLSKGTLDITAESDVNTGAIAVVDNSTLKISGNNINTGDVTVTENSTAGFTAQGKLSMENVNIGGQFNGKAQGDITAKNITVAQGSASLEGANITTNDVTIAKDSTVNFTATGNLAMDNMQIGGEFTGKADGDVITKNILVNEGSALLEGASLTAGNIDVVNGKFTAVTTGDVNTKQIQVGADGSMKITGANVNTEDLNVAKDGIGILTAKGNLNTHNLNIGGSFTGTAQGDISTKNITVNEGDATLEGNNITAEIINIKGNLEASAKEDFTGGNMVIAEGSATIKGANITLENIGINGSLTAAASEKLTTGDIALAKGTMTIEGKILAAGNISMGTETIANISADASINTGHIILGEKAQLELAAKEITAKDLGINAQGTANLTASTNITLDNVVNKGNLNIIAGDKLQLKDFANKNNSKLVATNLELNALQNSGNLNITVKEDITTKGLTLTEDSQTNLSAEGNITTSGILMTDNSALELKAQGDINFTELNSNSSKGAKFAGKNITGQNMNFLGTGSNSISAKENIKVQDIYTNGDLVLNSGKNTEVNSLKVAQGNTKVTGEKVNITDLATGGKIDFTAQNTTLNKAQIVNGGELNITGNLTVTETMDNKGGSLDVKGKEGTINISKLNAAHKGKNNLQAANVQIGEVKAETGGINTIEGNKVTINTAIAEGPGINNITAQESLQLKDLQATNGGIFNITYKNNDNLNIENILNSSVSKNGEEISTINIDAAHLTLNKINGENGRINFLHHNSQVTINEVLGSQTFGIHIDAKDANNSTMINFQKPTEQTQQIAVDDEDYKKAVSDLQDIKKQQGAKQAIIPFASVINGKKEDLTFELNAPALSWQKGAVVQDALYIKGADYDKIKDVAGKYLDPSINTDDLWIYYLSLTKAENNHLINAVLGSGSLNYHAAFNLGTGINQGWGAQEPFKTTAYQGLWATVQRSKISRSNYFDGHLYTTQIGRDYLSTDTRRQGYSFKYNKIKANYEFTPGTIKANALEASLYNKVKWGAYKEYYMNTMYALGYVNNHYDFNNNGDLTTGKYTTYYGKIRSEVGKHIDLKGNWYLVPQGELQIGTMKSKSYTTSSEVKVKMPGINTFQTRLGFVLGHNYETPKHQEKFYLTGNMYHEFLGTVKTVLQDGEGINHHFRLGHRGSWYSYGVGMEFAKKDKSAFHFNYGRYAGGYKKAKVNTLEFGANWFF